MTTQQAAQDLLGSIFKVATELVPGERASLMLREEGADEFVIVRARGLAEDVRRAVRVREGQGIAGTVAATKRPILVRSEEEARAFGPAARPYRSRWFVSVPIVVDDRAQGVINVADPSDGLPFERSDLETLEVLAQHIAACLVRQRLDEQLREMAETDPLTHLFNRRHFDRRLEAELSRARRSEESLALLMLDVNAFKEVNDRLGHQVGDELLRGVSAAIRRTIRAYDVPVRYGGDEFAIILPSADAATARSVGDRIVSAVAAFAVSSNIVKAVPGVGTSVGVATAPPADDTISLVERADAAMYAAKSAGGGVGVWDGRSEPVPWRAARGALATPYLKNPGRLARRELQEQVPAALAEEWNLLVVGREGQVLTIAMPEPSQAAVDAVSAATGMAIYPVYSSADEIEEARRGLPRAPA
jgi:diguanylate cyclase (GGDEF)-like protein